VLTTERIEKDTASDAKTLRRYVLGFSYYFAFFSFFKKNNNNKVQKLTSNIFHGNFSVLSSHFVLL
jgi:hypothetical protein